jgi:hypothetical protein
VNKAIELARDGRARAGHRLVHLEKWCFRTVDDTCRPFPA